MTQIVVKCPPYNDLIQFLMMQTDNVISPSQSTTDIDIYIDKETLEDNKMGNRKPNKDRKYKEKVQNIKQ